jgi:large subunit ribosomal protein L17
MRHGVKKHQHFKHKDGAHRLSVLRNLTTSFFAHGSLMTTQKRAIALVPYVDAIINTVNSSTEEFNKIRSIAKIVFTENASRMAFERSKKYSGQSSGFTRITPILFRDGDAAKLVKIELI